MKKKICLTMLFIFSMIVCFGQALISPVTINLPMKPPANTADWGHGSNMFVISAQSKMSNGHMHSAVIESRILVIIKRDGTKVCGSYTEATAPASNFSTPVKTWNGSLAAGLLGEPCTLAPGDYTLCVKFISMEAGIKLGEETCKPFSIESGTTPNPGGNPVVSASKFSPPTNIAPVNEKMLTEKEAKAPLTFRWTPIVPKPRDPVIYKLRVWQLRKGQTVTSAVKGNTPVVEREMNDQTQFVKNSLLGDIELTEGQAQLVWNVEASMNENVIGQSELTAFSVGSGGCITDYTPCVIDSINCLGNNLYKVYATFNVTKSGFGASSSSYTVYPTKIIQAQFYDQSINTIGSAIPINVNKSEGQSYQLIQNITIPTSVTTLKVKFDAQVQTSNISFENCVGSANAEMIVPHCKCNTCDAVKWTLPSQIKIDSSGFHATNNRLTLFGNIGFGPQKVTKLSAEIVDFYWYTEGDCKKCNSNDYYFGNITGGSVTGMTGTSVSFNGVPIPSSHQYDFVSPTLNGVTLNNPFNLNISLPPQTQLSCCTDCFRFCIRYTATFMENGVCKTCSMVKCYETKRNHKKVGPIMFPPLNSCGEREGKDNNHIKLDKNIKRTN